MANTLSEPELVGACRRGDQSAFTELVRLYQVRIYQLAFGMTTNHYAAEEVSQETFIRFWKSLGSGGFDSRQEVYPYLRTICANLCRDYFSQQKSRKTERINGLEIADKKAQADGPAGMLKQNVLDAVESLAGEYREVLMLRIVEGLSYEEISRIADCPIGTVMSRLFRARTELKDKLGAMKI
ncbi:MAG: sigma-70 family RNA polymerase sigma factor [Planctomycetota bacterium]